MKTENTLILYKTPDGKTALEVRMQAETVWLSLNQISELFNRDKSVISRHINNVFNENELEKSSVIANFATTAADGKKYNVDYYNLDVIISIGYRVKSKQGTEFRIWANKILKEYLINGYSLNSKFLSEHTQKIRELENAISLLSNIIERKPLSADEATGLLRVITDYTFALDLLDRYDHQTLTIEETSGDGSFQIDYAAVRKAVAELGKQTGNTGYFGKEKDESLKGSLAAIYQTFDGEEVYPSIEEKAANLLYFIVKNHSFVDGNKRIAAFLFLWFLEGNKILYKKDGSRRIQDNALVALTLMIAESRPEEKETIIKLVVNLINKKN
ncbi:MAG: cytochrome C biogenesis protein CycH [Fibrobacter sp.]|nr:cytochrome C biogenesis protein CycH [Fibrobacter sp.]